MRAMFSAGAIFILVSCADVPNPRIAGDVRSVSSVDIHAASAAVERFIRQTPFAHDVHGVFLIEVLDADEIRFYFGEHYGTQPPDSRQRYASTARIDGQWVAIGVTVTDPVRSNRKDEDLTRR